MKKIVIIGAGAAGLMAACSAACELKNKNSEIILIEKNERPGRKIMITGKGRCNVTNNCDVDTLINNTPCGGRFLYSCFNAFTPSDVMRFFEERGVMLKTERGNRVFPVSDKAVDIVDALHNAIKGYKVKMIHGTARHIKQDNGNVCGVILDDGSFIEADRVILATGGKSYPTTGSSGDGYAMASELGHSITEISPSLVPLDCYEGFCERLSGLSLKNVTLSVYEDSKKKPVYSELGEMLFTHFGISGPLVLSASAHIKKMGQKTYTALIDLKPALTAEQLDKRILRDFEEFINKSISNALDKLLPKSIIPIIISLSGIDPQTKVNSISREQRSRLVQSIKGMELHIKGFRPIEEAIITRGGIKCKEINPSTMESKLISGLFFAGETIDVDALTGGFNLQIAFSTGFAAGKNAADL